MLKPEMTGNYFIKADLKYTPKKVVMHSYGGQLVQGPDNCLDPITVSSDQALL